MKSCFSVEPLLPPPPYTWLMTTALGAIVPVTVSSVDAVAVPRSVVTVTPIVVLPGARASAAPVAGSIDATAGSLLVHAADLTVTRPSLAADAVKVSEPPGSRDGVRGAIDAESGVTGGSVLLPRLRGV